MENDLKEITIDLLRSKIIYVQVCGDVFVENFDKLNIQEIEYVNNVINFAKYKNNG